MSFLLDMLRASDCRIRAAACNLLAVCPEPRVLNALAVALQDAHPAVAAGAWRALRALRALTRKSLPRDSTVWMAWLGHRG